MFFRYSCSIYYESLDLSQDFEETEFLLDQETRVLLCGCNENRIRSDSYQFDPYCEITTEFDVDEKNKEILCAVSKGSVGEVEKGLSTYQIYETSSGDNLYIESVNDFPLSFRSFILSIQHRLKNSLQDFISILRWRMNSCGPNNLIRFAEFSWSQNQIEWSRFIYVFYPPLLEIREQLTAAKIPQKEILTLFNSFSKEPLYHELFRESWELRIKNPRSSIVIGISAAEVAMKECISMLAPQAQWLAEEAPTPPLVAMIKNYLPTLPAKNSFGGKVLAPPPSIRRDIEDGVKLRNKVVHVGRQAPEYSQIEKILLSVKDFLWLVDYYCGCKWSLTHIRQETIEAIQNS